MGPYRRNNYACPCFVPMRSTCVLVKEVLFVSTGNPAYRFVVWREAVRSLAQNYVTTMLDEILFELAAAHQDKGFDVIATMCDGAAEQ